MFLLTPFHGIENVTGMGIQSTPCFNLNVSAGLSINHRRKAIGVTLLEVKINSIPVVIYQVAGECAATALGSGRLVILIHGW